MATIPQAAKLKRVQSEPGLLTLIWEKLNSLPFVVVVLLIVGFFSITGTIISQEPLLQTRGYVTLIDTKIFGFIPYTVSLPVEYVEYYGPIKAWLLHFLGLTDIFHTFYFNLLLIWIAVSAFVCTFKKVEEAWEATFTPPVDRPASFFRVGRDRRELELMEEEDPVRQLTEALRRLRMRVRVGTPDEEGAVRLLAQKGIAKRWGLVLLHVSLSLLVVFATYGAIFSAQGAVGIVEGETEVFSVDPYENKGPLGRAIVTALGARPITVELELRRFEIPLNFLRYPPEWTRRPETPEKFAHFFSLSNRDYKSYVTARVAGTEKKWVIEVNRPLRIMGIDIYQNAHSSMVGFEIFSRTAELSRQFEVSMGLPFQITQDGRLVQHIPGQDNPQAITMPMAFTDVKQGAVYRDGRVIEVLPPTAVLEVYDPLTNDVVFRDIVSSEEPVFFTENIGLKLTERTRPISVFTYKYNPGMPGIYLASILIILGTLFSLYIPYYELYARVKGKRVQLRLVRQGVVGNPRRILREVEEELNDPARRLPG